MADPTRKPRRAVGKRRLPAELTRRLDWRAREPLSIAFLEIARQAGLGPDHILTLQTTGYWIFFTRTGSRLLNRLFRHYGIDPDPEALDSVRQLAFALALEHVPAFQFKQRPGPQVRGVQAIVMDGETPRRALRQQDLEALQILAAAAAAGTKLEGAIAEATEKTKVSRRQLFNLKKRLRL